MIVVRQPEESEVSTLSSFEQKECLKGQIPQDYIVILCLILCTFHKGWSLRVVLALQVLKITFSQYIPTSWIHWLVSMTQSNVVGSCFSP